MARDILLAFDDIIHGTANVYSSSFVELGLAESEAYAIQAVVEGMADVERITVQLETSTDGRNWSNKNPTPEIDSVSTPANQVTAAYGYDPGNFPAMALVRLRITLGIAGTSVARVRVYVRQTPGNYVNPARLPGCRLWLRADLGLTLQAANAVSNWADQSGNGNDASQAGPGQQPIWTPNQVNGLPTINFDGANDVLATPAFALGTYTVVMVTTGQDASNGWFWTRDTTNDTLYGTTNNTMYIQRGPLFSQWEQTAGWGQWGPSTAKILVVRFDGTHAGHTLRINALTQTMTTGGANDPGTTTTTDQFSIAARADAVLPSKINVAEVAIYDSSLPAPQLNALEEYARRRYKLY